MKYRILTDDRKQVVTKLEGLTGKKAVYTGTPRFAYTFDRISVECTEVVTEDGANEGLLWELVDEGLLEPVPQVHETTAPERATEAQEAPMARPEGEDGETANVEPETAGNGESEGGEEEETEDAGNTAGAEAETGEPVTEEPAGDTAEPEYESAAEEPETFDDNRIKPSFSFPLSQHRPDSLVNLIFMIYSKGDLLNKSSGGDFFVSEALKEKLRGAAFNTNEEVLRHLTDASEADLRGLSFTDGKVHFDGFPATDDPELIKAWMKLCEAINKAAVKQKRVQARRNDEPNEKFAFRTWLTRIGMNGPELKSERQIYYRNLTGHTAFRTPEDGEKWKKRQAQKREAAKAEKAEEATQEGEV